MSGRHQPVNGADSPEARTGPYVVDMRNRWDDDDRIAVRIPLAWGPRDAKNLAEDLHPEYLGAYVREVTQ